MKLIQTVDAEGIVLCHDITQVIKGMTKDVVFRKGHMATREDIPVLLNAGKDQLYAWKKEDGTLHENDAAEVLCNMYKGQYMERSQAKEGKIEPTAACDGLSEMDNRELKAVNEFGQMMIAIHYDNFATKKGDKLVGTRIIPLVTGEEKMEAAKKAAAEAIGGCPILELKPLLHKKVGIAAAGNEVFYGHTKGAFTPVIRGKSSEFDTEAIDHVTWNDDDTKATANTLGMIQRGANVAVCTEGMSVDPDDKTPLAIRSTGTDAVSYGASVLPGAMFLLACYQVRDGENPRIVAIMGLPGCVMYVRHITSDLILPRIVADDQVTADDLTALGQGGLCLNCPECTFPNYGFDKGM